MPVRVVDEPSVALARDEVKVSVAVQIYERGFGVVADVDAVEPILAARALHEPGRGRAARVFIINKGPAALPDE